MSQESPSSNRRKFLTALSSTGLTVLAGCNFEGSQNSQSTSTATETVIFTDSDTTPPASTPTKQVFDGGGIADFKRASLTALDLGVSLEIEPGTYTFEPLDSGEQAHLRLQDIQDLTIEGNGAKIIFSDPMKGGIRFRRGENITIRRLVHVRRWEYLPHRPRCRTRQRVRRLSRSRLGHRVRQHYERDSRPVGGVWFHRLGSVDRRP